MIFKIQKKYIIYMVKHIGFNIVIITIFDWVLDRKSSIEKYLSFIIVLGFIQHYLYQWANSPRVKDDSD